MIKTKTKFFVSLGIAVLLAITVFVANYTIGTRVVDGDVLINEIAFLETREQEAITIKNLLEKSDSVTNSISEFFVPASEIVRYIETIENKGRQANVLIAIESVSEPKRDGLSENEAVPFPAEFVVSGSRANIEAFLESLYKLPYHLQIDSLNLTARDSGTGWLANIIVTAYMIDSE